MSNKAGKSKKTQKSLQKDDSDVIKSLEEQLKESDEARLRALADYQNLQRRIQQEKEELSYTLNSDLLSKMIELKEDLIRFQKNEKQGGVQSIIDKIDGILRERGVEEIVLSSGDEFDLTVMEAVTTVPVGKEKESNKVIEIISKGYKLNGEKVIKSAKVVVGMYKKK